jgi:hypothetical protein
VGKFQANCTDVSKAPFDIVKEESRSLKTPTVGEWLKTKGWLTTKHAS